MKPMHAMQADTPDKGKLKIQINSEITSFPIADASISISYTGCLLYTSLFSYQNYGHGFL